MPWSRKIALLLSPGLVLSLGAAGESEALPSTLLALAVILVAAKVGGHLATLAGQPPVLGELLLGVVLGNLPFAGITGLEGIRTDGGIELLAGLGVLLLLFEIGLESTVGQMARVGLSSFLVAVIGVCAPFALGWMVSGWLLPGASVYVHAFLGATLTATSVGITARVLKDLGRSQTNEARIILGAAVIDDVLGLVILAVVGGVIAAANGGGALSAGAIGMILLKAAGFLAGSLALGLWLSPKLFHLASRLRGQGVLLGAGLGFCFVLSWLAHAVGLAPIVGAFAAGLLLEDLHFRDFTSRGERTLAELVHPISGFLVPVFFILMGMRTDLRTFASPAALGLVAALTLAAIVGKQICGLGVIGSGIDRVSVGIGMVPRGEVGLIFANIGAGLVVGGERVVSSTVYSAIVAMVMLTTLVTPPALRWSVSRRRA